MRTKEMEFGGVGTIHYVHRPLVVWFGDSHAPMKKYTNIVSKETAKNDMFNKIEIYDHEEAFFLAMMKSDIKRTINTRACVVDYKEKKVFYDHTICLDMLRGDTSMVAMLETCDHIKVEKWLDLQSKP